MLDAVAELGHLRKLAEQNANKRFNRLYRLVRQSGLLALARERIAGNKGAQTPGIDGERMKDINTEKVLHLSEELNQGTYQPQPVRRVHIPKRNGKLRPLGIPTSRDKIVQASVAFILEALYEPLFRKSSHGFRPQHSTITALRQASNGYRAGAKWIIEGDITDCFGSIPHNASRMNSSLTSSAKCCKQGLWKLATSRLPFQVHHRAESPVLPSQHRSARVGCLAGRTIQSQPTPTNLGRK